MSKAIKFKNNIFLDTGGIVHNRYILKDLLSPTLIYDGYITPNVGDVNVGSIIDYKRLIVILEANGSCTSLVVLPAMYDRYIGINWQAMDNRTATYYVTFRITSNGIISILYSGYTLSSSNSDYIREYGISKIYGYKL